MSIHLFNLSTSSESNLCSLIFSLAIQQKISDELSENMKVVTNATYVQNLLEFVLFNVENAGCGD